MGGGRSGALPLCHTPRMSPPFQGCGSHLRKLIARPGMVPEMHVEAPVLEMHGVPYRHCRHCRPNRDTSFVIPRPTLDGSMKLGSPGVPEYIWRRRRLLFSLVWIIRDLHRGLLLSSSAITNPRCSSLELQRCSWRWRRVCWPYTWRIEALLLLTSSHSRPVCLCSGCRRPLRGPRYWYYLRHLDRLGRHDVRFRLPRECGDCRRYRVHWYHCAYKGLT